MYATVYLPFMHIIYAYKLICVYIYVRICNYTDDLTSMLILYVYSKEMYVCVTLYGNPVCLSNRF